MRCLRRILLHTATALSLLLCTVTVLLWQRSYTAPDEMHWRGDWIRQPITREPLGSSAGKRYWTYVRGTYWCAGSKNGRVYFARGGEARQGFDIFLDAQMENQIDFTPAITGGFLGFGHVAPVGAVLQPCSVWFVPHWFIVLITAILPLCRWVAMERKRRVRPTGLCEMCGYDLRAIYDRCPECGTPVPEGHGVRVIQ